MKERSSSWMIAIAAVGALGTGACRGSGDPGSEAPARNGAATTPTTSGGDVSRDSAPGHVVQAPPGADTMPAAGVAGSGTAAVGSPQGSIHTPGSGTLHGGDPSDAAITAVAALIDGAEREQAQLATQKAQHPEVKRYAQAMLQAHPGSAPALQPAPGDASDLLVPMREAHVKAMQQLRATPSGPAFDRAYMARQVEGHQGALQALARLETATGDRALTAQLRQRQAGVQQHLQEAKRVQAALGAAG